MFKRLSDWLDARTGYRGLLHEALDEAIPGGARWRYVFGSALTAVFLIQLVTGLLLMTSYSPSATTAWGSVYYISYQMSGGWFLRGIHHFGSQAMVILLALHLCQVLWAGAYRSPREVNWWFGLALLFVTLGFSLTGYLLPWDQKGYWATKVATNIMGGAPVVGPYLQKVVVGGSDYGNQTLTRFYALHVGLLPALLVACLAAHVALFRKHGVTHPPETKGIVDKFWPKQVFLDMVASGAVFAILVFMVVYEGGANLDAPADPSSSDYPARPEWYFLSLFQMLKLFPGKYEMIGTIIVPGAILTVLFCLPLLDKVLPKGPAHFLACAFVFGLVGGAGYLTYLAMNEDWNNSKFQSDREKAEVAANRAKWLAREVGIAPDGPGYLLRRDPLFHGGQVLDQKCLSCHYYDGKGQASRVESKVTAKDLEKLGTVPRVEGIPDSVIKAVVAKVPGYQPQAGEPVKDKAGNAVVAYRFQGTNAKGEAIEAIVRADGSVVESTVWSKQSAADLAHFGSRGWIRGLLEDPKSATYFGKVPQCGGMARWKKSSKLTAKDLNDIADFFAKHVITTPADLPASEWVEQEEIQLHPGFKHFQEGGECAQCHVDWVYANDEAPNLYGWGSDWWIARMIQRPGSPHLYGFLDESEQMPAFADRLSSNDLEMIIKYLKDEYVGADTSSVGQGGQPGPADPR